MSIPQSVVMVRRPCLFIATNRCTYLSGWIAPAYPHASRLPMRQHLCTAQA